MAGNSVSAVTSGEVKKKTSFDKLKNLYNQAYQNAQVFAKNQIQQPLFNFGTSSSQNNGTSTTGFQA